MANLVIVESPSKASTIKGYLGSNYKVIASKGHVRDLPKSTLGVDIENNFDAHYINIRGKGDLIKEIRKEAKNANKVFLATDPDREGEAISWHLATTLGIPVEKTMRITFNEITKTAVKAAIKEPRTIDMDLVNAQQARRILDRIVGYKLSPFLWKNVRSGLSAGRVQSVATRIIVEREEEIRAFVPVEYWTIDAELVTEDNKAFTVRFYGNADGKMKLSCEEDAMTVVNAVKTGDFRVVGVKRAKRHKSPAPPFTTSTMQQEAARRLGFQSQKIMKIAQELYEGINIGAENGGVQGLITYMRTDSLRVSADAQAAAKEYIYEKYGTSYSPKTPREYKMRAGAHRHLYNTHCRPLDHPKKHIRGYRFLPTGHSQRNRTCDRAFLYKPTAIQEAEPQVAYCSFEGVFLFFSRLPPYPLLCSELFPPPLRRFFPLRCALSKRFIFSCSRRSTE